MMTIIVLWILLAIIALIVIILHFSVSLYLKFDDDGLSVKAKYMFFTLYPRKPKEKKQKKRKPKSNKKEQYAAYDDDFSDSLEDELDVSDDVIQESFVQADEQAVEAESESTAESIPESKAQPETEEKVPEAKPKPKKKKKKDKKKYKSEKKDGGVLSSVKTKFNKYKPYFPMGWKYFKKLLKAIRFTDVKIEVNVGREDAHEAAIYYGTVQGLVFNTLGHICNIFSVKIKKADVNCIFTKNTIDANAECYVRVRPSTLIAIAVCTGVNFLHIFLKQRRLNKKNQQNENKYLVEVN
ncbi:MAG: hypothetical protein Q4D35_03815 [Ruminococcus sp.]|nr:hypothetical protein [Ruminococcus sp.]